MNNKLKKQNLLKTAIRELLKNTIHVVVFALKLLQIVSFTKKPYFSLSLIERKSKSTGIKVCLLLSFCGI